MQFKYESEWRHLFPYETPRKEQSEAIEMAIDSIRNGNRYVILDLPTGIGKSSIGVTLARWAAIHLPSSDEEVLRGGTFLTTQKILQNQYLRDFDNIGMKSLQSSKNYPCSFNPDETCFSAKRLMDLKGRDKKAEYNNMMWRESCSPKSAACNCVYQQAKMSFLTSELAITSFAYFLNSKQMPKRQLLIIDEAHNIENQLMMYVETRIDRSFCENILNLQWPSETDDIHSDTDKAEQDRELFKNWVLGVYYPRILEEEAKSRKIISKLNTLEYKLSEAKDIIRAAENVIEAAEKIKAFASDYVNNESNWVPQIELKWKEDKNGKKSISNRYLVYKTVDISSYANTLLYSKGNYVICLSATILNAPAFAASVGIASEKFSSLSKNSPFPIENRMTYLMGCGSMGFKDKEETLPKVIKTIEEILEDHKGDKGIIHTHTYSNAQYIKNNINKKYLKRLLFHGADDRDLILEQHCERTDNDTVIISPSMAEGVDLKDDLSRFQVIMKVPYPYLGDPLVKRKMELNKTWYPYQAVKTLCQMLGRSIRNENDKAETYILDSGFANFYRQNRKLFPDWFSEAYRVLNNK